MPKSYRLSSETIKHLENLLSENPHIKNYDQLFKSLIKTYKANDNFYLAELYQAIKHLSNIYEPLQFQEGDMDKLKSELLTISKIVEASGFTLKLEPKKIELTQEQYRFFQKMKGSYNFDDDKHIE